MSQRGGGYNRRGGRGGGFGGGRRGSHNHGGRGGGGGPSSQQSSDGGSHRPPPHLKGKQIGMWYAMRSKNKTRENLPCVQLSPYSRAKITGLVQELEDLAAKSSSTSESKESNSDFLQRYRQNLFDNAAAVSARDLHDSGTQLAVKSTLVRIPVLDETLGNDLNRKQQSQKYQSMLKFREKLPAYKNKDEFLKLISQNQVIVVSGETGCGKTTQCCQLILDEMIRHGDGSLCKIVCTQPRRISAISVAERVADERDERVGGKSVGYCIRLESRIPTNDSGTILFCTTGVIFQHLKTDPLLSNFSHIVVDEIHERDVLSDFLLTILKDLILLRPELKVILMSATINADHFSKYFDNCPRFNIPGFTYPVEEFYLEDVLKMTGFVFESRSSEKDERPSSYKGRNMRGHGHGSRGGRHHYQNDDSEYDYNLQVHLRHLERERLYPPFVINELSKPESEELNMELVEALLRHISATDKDNGAVLIFVPGWDQISKLHTQLQSSGRFTGSEFLIIPLHSLMPTVNQKEVFNRPPAGKRKVVIATNIAETSITIDDIVHVIDTGKIKMTNFDVIRNIESLDTEWVSLANATQRKGRAGRVQEGKCYHFYNKAREMTLESFKKPEILRKRLEEVVLQIKVLRLGAAWNFLRRVMDPPSKQSVELAIKRLMQLRALDDDENLTPLGFHLAQLPMDPQTGKMILMAGIFGCVDPITTVAASLSFKDAFYIPLGQEKKVDLVRKDLSKDTKSDHMVNVYAMEGYREACKYNRERDYCYRNFISMNTIKLLTNMKSQFAEHLYNMKFISSPDFQDESNNINSKNIALVKAIICAGLYPNVAKIHIKRKRDGGYTYPKVGTAEDGKLDIHPKSVNSDVRQIESPFLVYYQKMKSKSILLYDTTMVSPFPLMFFGGNLRFRVEKNIGIVNVDSNADLKIDRETFDLMQALRKHLDKYLEQKIQYPGPTCWNALSKEGAMLRAITGLITAEYNEMFGDGVYDSDSD